MKFFKFRFNFVQINFMRLIMFKDKITKKDVQSILKFFIAYPIAIFLKNKKIWLFSERPKEARDNAYALFKYIIDNKLENKIYYLIDNNSTDKAKITSLGENLLIKYGSFKHYIYYLASHLHISAHIDLDSPNSRVSNFLETHKLLKNKRVFLQHGITKDRISFGYYSVSRADLFVCGAKKEYEFCKKEFGYPEGNVQLLGFPRFDNLWDYKFKRQILLMPTWRVWLANSSTEEFLSSEYYKKYNDLLNCKRFLSILEKNDLNLIFLPHSDMQNFVNYFKINSSRIEIADFSNIERYYY